MFTLAHLTDLHLARPPRFSDLAGKRGLGFINWHRRRKFIHRPDVLESILRDLPTQHLDHTVITGDLVNLSLPAEYAYAAQLLARVAPPDRLTVIPGNHDAYVRSAIGGPAQWWNAYMRGDDAISTAFPFVRRRGPVALIALSSAVPTGAFMATGRLGDDQLQKLAAALRATSDAYRIVLIHHPPVSAPGHRLRRLTDSQGFCAVLAACGAELVLHGHDHRRSIVMLAGPTGPIPALGAPSASALIPRGHEDAAGYNLLHIGGGNGDWRCELVARQRGADGTVTEIGRQMLTAER